MIPQPALLDAQANLARLLDRDGVHYLVIGGWAVRANGYERETFDLDLLLPCSAASARRVARAFDREGFPHPPQGWVAAASTPGLRLAYPHDGPGKVGELLTSINGIDFRGCYERSERVAFGDLVLHVVSRPDLIAMKRISVASTMAAARERDLRDVEHLEALQGA